MFILVGSARDFILRKPETTKFPKFLFRSISAAGGVGNRVLAAKAFVKR
jgi:hypothetical protein